MSKSVKTILLNACQYTVHTRATLQYLRYRKTQRAKFCFFFMFKVIIFNINATLQKNFPQMTSFQLFTLSKRCKILLLKINFV